MNFDISKAPPTAAELVEERGRHEAAIKRSRRLELGSGAALILIAAAMAGAAMREPALGDRLGAVELLELLLMSCGFAVLIGCETWITRRRNKAIDGLRAIDIVSTERCPQVLAWCREHEELATYQRQVVAMNRFLTEGETDSMQAWVDSIGKRAEAQRRQDEAHAACRALREPVELAKA